jgi:hypothetical protein
MFLKFDGFVLYRRLQEYKPWFSITGAPVAEDISNTIVVNKTFDEPFLFPIVLENQVFTGIELSNCISIGKVGDPTLPICSVYILIPRGKEIENINVNHLDEIKLDHNLSSFPITPQQEEIPLSCDTIPDFTINHNLYSFNTATSSITFENKGTGFMNGFNILTLNLNPVKYIPAKGELYYYPKMEIVVTLANAFGAISEQDNKFLRLTESDVNRVSSLIENPNSIISYSVPVEFGTLGNPLNGNCTCNPAETYEYVIITDESLLNSSGYNYSWYDLIEHRRNYSGLNGTIVTVQQIENCSDYQNNTYPFNDSVYSIREFIKDAYQNWDTEYVLLGGNWRDSDLSGQTLPYRLFTDRYETDAYDTMPCDLYYSNLDGDWWYSNYSVWGGGKNSPVNDKFSEIYVGRITAYAPEHVSNAVSKIIWYDMDAHNETWLRTATFAGGSLGWTVTSKKYMEELRIGNGSYSENVGFGEWNSANPNYQLYTLENRYYYDDGNWGDFTNSIESDNSSLINHIGHAGWDTPFSLSNWLSRNNSLPFFGYSQGCLAGRFSSGFSGCEQLVCSYLEKHAFAVVLNTGYGYGNSFSTEGSSQQQQKIFWDYFFDENASNSSQWELGRSHAYSKDEFSAYIDSSHAKCYVWYSAHLFGDPAQKLKITNEIKSNGEPCLSGAECQSGYCVDGACCSSASCGVCQACNINGSEGNCSNQPLGSDLHNDCSTADCGMGYCNGLGACGIYNDSLKHNCSSCYYCADSNVSCDLVPSGQDLNNDCIKGNTSSDGCAGDYCDGNGSCQIISSGDGNCPACTLCLDNDTQCEYYSNNTQDDGGNLTCSGICKKCNGLGQCINQTAGEDLFDECDNNLECHIGICDGFGECDVYSNGEKGSCGACKYCNDTDSNCEYVPSGQDLFDECVGLQCDSNATIPYYWGWDSLTCYYASDVVSRDHYCNGDGSCYDASICSSQGQDDSTGVTCECVEAQQGCSGTTIGSCQNCGNLNNSAPTTPTLISPVDGINNTDNSVDFDWSDSTDEDDDNISYYLAINSSSNSTLIIYSSIESIYSSYPTVDNVTYYWKVKAGDGLDNGSWSSMYQFTEIIEGEEEPEEEMGSSSGGGGGGSASPISSTSTTPQSITYDLSETSEEEVKEIVKSKLNEVSSNTKKVYKDVSVDVSVDHPSSESTSLDFSFKYSKGKPLKNVMIFIEVPKSFAESAADISFESSVPYSKMEVVEDDPLYYFYYESLVSENISYSFHNNEYSIGSKVLENVTPPRVFFETEEKSVPKCGNNIVEDGEECDSISGLREGYRCSSECKLVPISHCIDDGNCTQKEIELGSCNDCLTSTPKSTSAYVILYQKGFIALLIIFIVFALVLGLKLEMNKKKRKK